jgi:L-rhamnose mutarotase
MPLQSGANYRWRDPMQQLAFAVDLKDDPALIAEHEAWHRADRIWPAIVESLQSSGITELRIFRTGTRLFLLIEAPDTFSLQAKARADATSVEVQAWERLMWQFQQALPWAQKDQKWVPMQPIFSLADCVRRSES